MNQIPATQLSELSKVQEQFAEYRRSRKNHRQEIPDQLWEMAARLTEQFSVNHISKVLSLDYNKLKAMAKNIRNRSDMFISVAAPEIFEPAKSKLQVEILQPGGTVIRIYNV